MPRDGFINLRKITEAFNWGVNRFVRRKAIKTMAAPIPSVLPPSYFLGGEKMISFIIITYADAAEGFAEFPENNRNF